MEWSDVGTSRGHAERVDACRETAIATVSALAAAFAAASAAATAKIDTHPEG